MNRTQDRPAILGGDPVQPMPTWPPRSPRAEAFVADALNSRRPSGYGSNDAPYRTRLEQATAAHADWAHGIATTNGADAVHLAVHGLLALRGRAWSRHRDAFLVPDLSAVLDRVGAPESLAGVWHGACAYLGRPPSLVALDARPEDWTLDERDAVAWLEQHGGRTLGVLVSSLLDSSPQLAAIVAAAARHGVPVVHDGAHAGGAVRRDRRPACETRSFRLDELAGRASGEGGVVFTDDDQLASIMRRLTDCWGVPGGPLDPGGSLVGIEPPFAGNKRMPALLAAAALGGHDDLVRELPTIRAVRRALGTEVKDPDGLVVFRLAPIQPDWDTGGPTSGLGMELTEEARAEYRLDTTRWRAILAADGFANDEQGYRFGVRRAYLPAHASAPWNGVLVPADRERGFPRVRQIERDGLILHGGHLLDERTPERLARSIARVAPSISAVRWHLDAR